MASPTPNKALTYPIHGGAVGSWDSNLNANFDELDLLLGGTLPIALAGANVILTTVQSQNLTFQLTGVLLANVSIQWPAVGGFYIIDNQTTGAFTVTLQTAGGGLTTTAPQGFRVFVVSNGNDMFPANTAVAGNFSIGGTLSVTGVPSFTSTSHALIPSGTTAQRPAVPATANARFNSTLGLFEYYDGTSWNQPSNAQPVAAGFKNLKVTNNAGTPNTQVDITADAVTVETTGGTAYRLRTISVTINGAVAGAANALDAGALAASTWYSQWIIYNPTTATTAGLMSLSATAPTLPAGYTAQARLGWMQTDASTHFFRTIQYAREAQYIIGTNPTIAPLIDSGVRGTFSTTSPTLLAVTVVGNGLFVPSTAGAIKVLLSNSYKSGTTSNVEAAPSTGWGGANNGPAGSNGNVYPLHMSIATGTSESAWFTLESTTIAWASSGASGAIACLGWYDNI